MLFVCQTKMSDRVRDQVSAEMSDRMSDRMLIMSDRMNSRIRRSEYMLNATETMKQRNVSWPGSLQDSFFDPSFFQD